MIRGYEDQFVGAVAVGLGLFLLGASAFNWNWYYSLPSARFVTRRVGRAAARLLHAVLAIGLIALGVAVAQGFQLWRGS